MRDSFDPYQDWFGIPPSDQPPDHYRLLGLEPFEDSASKIEDAVVDRAEFLQTVSMGQHVAEAQRILNEVARARICLVNSDRKRDYDQQLRDHAASPVLAQPIPMAVSLSEDLESENALKDLQLVLENRKAKTDRGKPGQPHPPSLAKNSRQRSTGRNRLTVAIGGVMLCLIAVTVGFFRWGGKADPEISQQEIQSSLDKLQLPSLDLSDSAQPRPPVTKPEINPPKPNSTGGKNKAKGKAENSAANKKAAAKTKPKTGNNSRSAIKPTPPKSDFAKSDLAKPDASKPKGTQPASAVPVANVNPAGNQPAAKNSPAKAAPSKTPRPNPVPESRLTFPAAPFKYFRQQFYLPPLQNVKAVKIDDLFLPSSAPLDLELIYDKSWSRAKDNFRLNRSDGNQRSWDVVREISKDDRTVKVARFWVEDNALHFQWLSSANEDEDTNYLRNGVLKLRSSETQVRKVNLRSPKTIPGFQFSEDKYSVREKAELTWLPNQKSLKIEMLPLPERISKPFLDPKLVTNKPGRMFFAADASQRFLWLEVSGDVRANGVSLDAVLKFPDSQGRPRTFSTSNLEKQTRILAEQIKTTQRMVAAAKEKAQKDQLNSRLQAQKKLLETANRYAALVPKLHDQNIGVKVYYEAEDRRVEVAKTGFFKGPATRGRLAKNPELPEYQIVYDLDLNRLSKEITYDLDFSDSIGEFDRIGYLLELVHKERGQQFVFVTVDAFTTDVKKIGIPTFASKAQFQLPVKSMNVYSNVKNIVAGTNIATGNMEFWPGNYSSRNTKAVEGASNEVNDFGDERSGRGDYGTMQIHNFGASQTLFAINNWKAGKAADIGIGNSPGKEPDWTFSKSASQYRSKRLRVFVRLK